MRDGRRRAVHLITACGAAASFGAAALSILRPAALANLDNLFFDAAARQEQASVPCRAPIVVALDDEALARFGQWPWPRALFAKLLDRVAALEPNSVGIDVLFSEPERPRGAAGSVPSEGDAALAESLRRGPFVLGWEFVLPPATAAAPRAPGPVAVGITAVHRSWPADPAQGLWTASGAVTSLPDLTGAVEASGFLNAGLDPDGTLRRLPVLIEHDGALFPSLGLATALEALGVRQAVLESSIMGGRVLDAGGRRIPLDSKGRLLLRYRCGGPVRVSAAAVLEGRLPPEAIEGRAVFIGAAGTGLGESIATPVAPALPGVVVHAIAAGNVLEGDFARPAAPLVVAPAVLALGLAATFVCLRLRPLAGALVLGAAAVAAWWGSAASFHATGLMISPVLAVFTLAAIFAVLTLVRVVHDERLARAQARDLAATRDLVTESLASLAAIRDTETGAHILRTQRYVRSLCLVAARHPRFRDALTPRTIELIAKLAPIHDIGKVGVPDDLLHKPTRFTAEELEVMKRHALHGREAIAKAETRVGAGNPEFLRIAKDLAYSHHERWDGSGYPEGLSGDRIPLAGRLMAIADVYDALVNLRVYKEALPHEEAVRFIREGRGTQFDPDLVDAFLAVEGEWLEIRRELARTDEAEAAAQGAG